MKKIKKILEKLNNRGSSLVLVVVSLAFIGVIVGSLLSAALYGLRIKHRDLNAKDNFYVLEQSMNEIYTGVGGKTAGFMQDAYFDTLENMVEFDLATGKYVAKSAAEADSIFKQEFLNRTLKFLKGQDVDSINIIDYLEAFISDEKVELDGTALYVEPKYTPLAAGGTKLDSITIHNVVLTRTASYANAAKGTFTQTIATDIVISEPTYDFSFDDTSKNTANIYNFAAVADMGMEISQSHANKLSILGNVYAGSDFYNKNFNADKTGTLVSSKQTGNGSDSESKYSGLYIKDSDVNIIADSIIVPGTLSVMDNASLVVQGKGGSAEGSEVWTDNIVLDKTAGGVGKPSAQLYANLFVKDDTELNAEESDFSFIFAESSSAKGGYYGYSYSSAADNRVFAATVDATAMKEYANDKHYNSSSIAINGNKSELNIENADVLYLAGRTYIQLSKFSDTNGNTLDDIKTGESISIKSNQTAYIPNSVKTDDVIEDSYAKDGAQVAYKKIKIVGGDDLTDVFFPKFAMDGYAPVQIQSYNSNGSLKTTYFYDLDVAWDILYKAYNDASAAEQLAYENKLKAVFGDSATFESVFGGAGQKYAQNFISVYAEEKGLSKRTEGAISINGSTNNYASGALTTGSSTGAGTYSIITPSVASAGALLGVADGLAENAEVQKLKFLTKAEVATMTSLSDSLAKEYNYMKWNLAHYDAIEASKEAEIDAMTDAEKNSLTPINNYFDVAKIDEMTDGNGSVVSTCKINNINNTNYNVVVSKNDVEVDFSTGIVVTLGDVHFSSSFSGEFEGLIVAGGKIYVGDDPTAIVRNLKANPEICKAIIRNLQLIGSADAENYAKATSILKVLNCYVAPSGGDPVASGSDPSNTVTIDMISYSDVIQYSNWMRNVE